MIKQRRKKLASLRQITITTEDNTVIYDTPEKIERLLNAGWKKTGSNNSIYIHVNSHL